MNCPECVFTAASSGVMEPGSWTTAHLSIHVVDRDVKVANALSRMQVHCKDSVGSRLSYQVGGQLGSDGLTSLRRRREGKERFERDVVSLGGSMLLVGSNGLKPLRRKS